MLLASLVVFPHEAKAQPLGIPKILASIEVSAIPSYDDLMKRLNFAPPSIFDYVDWNINASATRRFTGSSNSALEGRIAYDLDAPDRLQRRVSGRDIDVAIIHLNLAQLKRDAEFDMISSFCRLAYLTELQKAFDHGIELAGDPLVKAFWKARRSKVDFDADEALQNIIKYVPDIDASSLVLATPCDLEHIFHLPDARQVPLEEQYQIRRLELEARQARALKDRTYAHPSNEGNC